MRQRLNKATQLTAQQRPLADRPAPSIRRGGMFALLLLGLLLWAAPAAQAQNRPGPVTNLKTNPGNQSITVTWGPPTDNGGSPIASYTVECKAPGGLWQSEQVWAWRTSYTFDRCRYHNPLQNGTQYTFRVLAVNSSNSGSYTEAGLYERRCPGRPDADGDGWRPSGGAELADRDRQRRGDHGMGVSAEWGELDGHSE